MGKGVESGRRTAGLPPYTDPNPSGTDFRQKIARCVSWHTKPFSVPENALPLAGVKTTPLNDRENARFLAQWEQSGVTSKSRFIAARLFGEPFRVVKVDKSAVEYCAKLTEFYAQFRAVAVNYNQVVKALHSNFSEKKALAFLYKLEKATTELAMLNRQVIDLTNECRELWLPR